MYSLSLFLVGEQIEAFPRKSVPIIGGDANDYWCIFDGYRVNPDNKRCQ
jgi:hypothetical protein